MLGRALTYLVLYSTLGMMVSVAPFLRLLQLRWSWGVKLLSQADDEAPTVESVTEPIVQQTSNIQIQSPEPLEAPHPGARETDPFFTNTKNISQDEQDERRNPSRSFASAGRSLSPESSWQPDLASARSAHPMAPSVTRRGSASVSISGRSNSRRDSSQGPQRRAPTRTDSGREFWGLPEVPRKTWNTFEDVQEDSSEDEAEFVGPYQIPWLTVRGMIVSP